MTIYEKIQELLAEKNISAYKFCRGIGINSGVYSNWRTGNPKYKTVQKVADYFQIDVSYFYDENITLKEYRESQGLKEQRLKRLLAELETLPTAEALRIGVIFDVLSFESRKMIAQVVLQAAKLEGKIYDSSKT